MLFCSRRIFFGRDVNGRSAARTKCERCARVGVFANLCVRDARVMWVCPPVHGVPVRGRRSLRMHHFVPGSPTSSTGPLRRPLSPHSRPLPNRLVSATRRPSFDWCLFGVDQAQALALRVEHLVWGVEAMSAGLSMGQLDTLKAVLLDQVARVDEAKVCGRTKRAGELLIESQ